MLSSGTTVEARNKRNVLKSIVRSQSSTRLGAGPPTPAKDKVKSQEPLGEINDNLERAGPSRILTPHTMDKARLLSRKSKTDMKAKDYDSDKSKVDAKTKSPKKTKSSTNLVALLGKGRSKPSKEVEVEIKNKENEPPRAAMAMASPPPIWAQFSSQQTAQGMKIALNDVFQAEHQTKGHYTQDRPVLSSRNTDESSGQHGVKIPLKAAAEDRPQSSGRTFGLLHRSNSSKSIKDRALETLNRGREGRPTSRPPTSDGNTSKVPATNRGQSRVRAAVAALSNKEKEGVQPLSTAKPAIPVNIEKEFEDMLEARNIAPEVREKMRALETHIKADLLKQDNGNSQGDSGSSGSRAPSRPPVRSRTNTNESMHQTKATSNDTTEKKPRPRSFTGFTLGKGQSSPKKQKDTKSSTHTRGKSADIPRSTSTTSLVSVSSASNFNLFGKAPKAAVPDDFIGYLRANTKPQSIEVGKIQKLRQLLRNETVAWVDEFIQAGGMVELVNLVYRIIDIEWREEHEDNLLHHTLTCLKALTTTSAAMQQLEGLQGKLFPALLALLFSSGEEKKGPSEFTTRGLIIALLCASITASPTPQRARLLLSYLKDPASKEATVDFIAGMHRPRPYKIWVTEITNVTREVFWIFLHSTNIIEYPPEAPAGTPFHVAHFPSPRPPVPAAPYVGSVEWDATIYLAIQIDLLNSLIASLGSTEERNQIRLELRDSGLEKVMGGTLRICKEKFYGHVHAGLSTWAGAARADGWGSKDVREGPRKDPSKKSRSASPNKADQPPVLAMPKLDFQAAKPLLGDTNNAKFDAWL